MSAAEVAFLISHAARAAESACVDVRERQRRLAVTLAVVALTLLVGDLIMLAAGIRR